MAGEHIQGRGRDEVRWDGRRLCPWRRVRAALRPLCSLLLFSSPPGEASWPVAPDRTQPSVLSSKAAPRPWSVLCSIVMANDERDLLVSGPASLHLSLSLSFDGSYLCCGLDSERSPDSQPAGMYQIQAQPRAGSGVGARMAVKTFPHFSLSQFQVEMSSLTHVQRPFVISAARSEPSDALVQTEWPCTSSSLSNAAFEVLWGKRFSRTTRGN